MTIRTVKLGGTDWSDGQILYAADQNDTFAAVDGALGEVRMFALSMTGAITKANLQTRGWAICDGTTPATQGISSPTITTTPDLQESFIRMSDDETSGTTGGAETHNHTYGTDDMSTGGSGNPLTSINSANHLPPYYEMAFFMKVV